MRMLQVLLAHGASGNAASMRPHVAGLTARGLEAHAVGLPRGSADHALPVYATRLAGARGRAVVGGHSFGGRVASMLAAGDTAVAGLVLLSYPLHRPGHPDEQRTEHWPRISCPALLLSGESDPFARVELLRAATSLLRDAELITYPRVGHGLAPVLDDALDRITTFVRRIDG